MYKKPRHDLGLCGLSFARYSEKCFIQMYRTLYGDAMLVPSFLPTSCWAHMEMLIMGTVIRNLSTADYNNTSV